jgi:hypothetical protein
MKDLIKSYDELPVWFKFVLALPMIDGVAYGIYRIAKGIHKKDLILIIIGIIWFPFGAFVGWILDMYSVYKYGKVQFFT